MGDSALSIGNEVIPVKTGSSRERRNGNVKIQHWKKPHDAPTSAWDGAVADQDWGGVPRVDGPSCTERSILGRKLGCVWRDLPEYYVPRTTCHNGFPVSLKASVDPPEGPCSTHTGNIPMIDSASLQAPPRHTPGPSIGTEGVRPCRSRGALYL